MKESMWGYLIVVLGVIGIAVILIFQDVTTTNDQNFFLLREVTEAAMIDSIDLTHFRITGRVAIDQERFVEIFLRRFAESATFMRTYRIDFFDIVEEPPKVSIQIGSRSNVFTLTGETFDIINRMDAILESQHPLYGVPY